MAATNMFLDLLKCRIRFNTPEGKYEGVIEQVIPTAEIIIIGKLILLPDRRMGCLNFRFEELSDIQVISRPVSPKESIDKKDVSPVYPKTKIEKLFDFSGNNDIEVDDDDSRAEYALKLVPHLSKFVPRDYEIIDCFNRDFDLGIKHIMKQNAIGVSLEGVKIGRSGTLTWLCISTPCCSFLFDILTLGELAFKKGLKAILEDASIQKIIHDCRLASDCLFHKYGVRLVNVFDTQVADFIVMMQMCENQKINNRVNTLDACLQYYLEVPYDYLYGLANFESNEDSLNFHALRPLHHEIQDVLIKNVMYLHLLKRELELGMQTPLRRATDVYLNSVQKLKERELLLVEHKPDELPPDIHLEGIQIFRYRDFENFCSTVASGPPYREINNPMKEYLNYRSGYKDGQKDDKNSILNKHSIQDAEVTSSGLSYKASKSSSQCVISSGRSCESDQESSSDCKRNQIIEEHLKNNPSRFGSGNNTYKSILNSKTPSTKNPTIHGLVELLSRSRGTMDNVKAISEESSQISKCSSQVPDENINVDEKPLVRHWYTSVGLANLKFSDNRFKDNTFEAEESQLRRQSEENQVSRMPSRNPLKTENSANESSESIYKYSSDEGCKKMGNVKTIPSTDLVHINNSEVKDYQSIPDSDFEEITARVKARGVALRNRKTDVSANDSSSVCNTFSQNVKFNPKETVQISSNNLKPTSEDVTIYYSDVLDKPTKFSVKVSNKSCRLEDLYKKAGDFNLLWSEEDSKGISNSSPNPHTTFENSEEFWASIRRDHPCKTMDEKRKIKFIPAGMAGY